MDKQFLVVRESDGLIYGVALRPDPDAGPIIPQENSRMDGAVEVPYDGEFSRAGRRDTEAAYWRDGAVEWVDTAPLEEAKAKAWDLVKQARDAAESGVFRFDGDLYDINKANVAGAALAALMAQLAGQPYSVNWTLADNTIRTLDGAAMQRLGIALVTHLDGLHATGRELRARIEAATTIEEAYAVTWPIEELNYEQPAAPAA